MAEASALESLLSETARSAGSSAIRDLLRHAGQPGILSLAGGLPAPELFPVAELGEAGARVAADRQVLQYGPTEGAAELREWIADRHGSAAVGHRPEASQVVVTTGSQQALDLIARVLLDPGDTVVVGDPCYVGARQALSGHGPKLVTLAVDADGIDVERLSEMLAEGLRPKMVYVVANFDNPSGAVLSLERREVLARLADTHGFLVVEDNPYGDLRFEGDNIESVATLSDWVVELRTASKIVAPGLRVGWMVGPRWLIDAVVIAKQAVDLHTSTVTQAIFLDLVGRPGWLDSHLETLRPPYRARRDALVAALDQTFPEAEYVSPKGGMFCWVRLPGCDTSALLTPALAAGVAFVPGPAFAVERDLGDCLRLSYATVDASMFGEAIDRLRSVCT